MTNQNQSRTYRVSREIMDYTHRQKAVSKLKKSGIVFPSKPAELPPHWKDEDGMFKMPQDITSVDYRELGQLMSTLNSLLQWYGAVLASSRVDKLTAERVKNFTEAKIRMEILSDKEMAKEYKAREDKEAYVNINEMVTEAQDWFDAQESLVTMTEQLYKDYERSYSLVSREISRRGNEMGSELREGNLR
jgi:ElaB/YqjD/DUF883 family membrane-anchored ribosome-binding protein